MTTTASFKETLKNAADKVARYVENMSEMKVETLYVEMGADSFDDAKLAARSIVRLDGDSQSVLPMKRDEAGNLVVDVVVYDLHQQNVQDAIDYRAEMMERLLTVLRGE